MVYDQHDDTNYADGGDFSICTYGSTSSAGGGGGDYFAGGSKSNRLQHDEREPNISSGSRSKRSSLASIQVPAYQHQPAFMNEAGDWSSIAEATMPLKTSELLKSTKWLGQSGGGGGASGSFRPATNLPNSHLFQASVELRSKEISRKLIWINAISLLINLALALVAFYFAFVNNSSATSAFAADCVLDFISSAIVLWRYHGDLNSVYLQAREQIACIYLGALFEISAFGIIIKGASDIAKGVGPEEGAVGYDLIYLAIAATLACTVLTIFKCSLYKTVRDKSILLDVINTVISTIFAMSIIMSQLLINVDASFWYMDPILSIVLAIFMAGFGLKVISQNFHVLRPANSGTTGNWPAQKAAATYKTPLTFASTNKKNYDTNLQASVEQGRRTSATNWQKSDYSSIAFNL